MRVYFDIEYFCSIAFEQEGYEQYDVVLDELQHTKFSPLNTKTSLEEKEKNVCTFQFQR